MLSSGLVDIFFVVHFSFKNIIFYRTAPVGLIQQINLGGGSPEKINFYCRSVFVIYFIQFFTPSQILVYSLELHRHLCKNATIHAKIIMYFEFILSVLHRNRVVTLYCSLSRIKFWEDPYYSQVILIVLLKLRKIFRWVSVRNFFQRRSVSSVPSAS